MENLDEILLLKSKKGLDYLNKKSFDLIDEV
jgi:hypothetical protein